MSRDAIPFAIEQHQDYEAFFKLGSPSNLLSRRIGKEKIFPVLEHHSADQEIFSYYSCEALIRIVESVIGEKNTFSMEEILILSRLWKFIEWSPYMGLYQIPSIIPYNH